jgi:hypothetical protein
MASHHHLVQNHAAVLHHEAQRRRDIYPRRRPSGCAELPGHSRFYCAILIRRGLLRLLRPWLQHSAPSVRLHQTMKEGGECTPDAATCCIAGRRAMALEHDGGEQTA